MEVLLVKIIIVKYKILRNYNHKVKVIYNLFFKLLINFLIKMIK